MATRHLAPAFDPALAEEMRAFSLLARQPDYADLFAERRWEKRLEFADGRVIHQAVALDEGVGVRWLSGGRYRSGHVSGLSPASVRVAVSAATVGESGAAFPRPPESVSGMAADWGTEALAGAAAAWTDAHRASDRVRWFAVEIRDVHQQVWMVQPGGPIVMDRRRYSMAAMTVTASSAGRTHMLSHTEAVPGSLSDLLPRLAAVAAEVAGGAAAMCSPAGRPEGALPAVFSGSAAGFLIHEVCGHPLEGDLTARGVGPFAGRDGKAVASPQLTIDDVPGDPRGVGGRRDDEGVRTRPVRLVDCGVFVRPLWDQMGAWRAGVTPTGSGRRQSWEHIPLARASTTVVSPGSDGTTADLLAGLASGLWVKRANSGLLDPITGQFQIRASEVYAVRRGRVAEPLGGLLLGGDAAQTLASIRAVASDSSVTTQLCGKGEQVVPVSVVTPALLLSRVEVKGRC